ncbi:MAG: beta-ketoacyl-ACP synthase III [Brevinematia bacterium]
MYKAKISGIGKYLPEKVLTNFDLEKMVDTTNEWIVTRTGIKERHIASEGETTSFFGAKAAEEAIKRAGISKDDIEMIIVATFTPDMLMPSTACIIQDILKIPDTGAIDIEAACSGFLYGLSMANAYVVSGTYRNVLVIGSETISRFTDWEDRSTCVLFGDGAGAVVVSRAEENEPSELIGFKLFGDGSYKDMLCIEAGGALRPSSVQTVANRQHYLKMNGNSTFKVAVRTMADMLESILEEHKVDIKDVKYLIPHQANIRIINAVAERLNLPTEKVIVNIDKYANTSAATIPIAMEEAITDGRIKRGDLIAMVAFGGGFTSAAGLMVY